MNRIVFMGTPEFSVLPLEKLFNDKNISVELVITGQDKKRSRNKLEPTPVKKKALELGIESYEPDNVNSKESLEKINKINPDFIVVIAYGQLIKRELLEGYRDRIINIHSSLLPKYRGAAPMQFSILNREKLTGVTAMLIEKGMDSGDILGVREFPMKEDTDIETLHDSLSKLGAELIVDVVNNYDKAYINRKIQDHDKATFSSKITKEMGHIDFNKPAEYILGQVLAFSSWPGTYVIYKDLNVKVHNVSIIERYNQDEKGKIVRVDDEAIYVNCSDKTILINEIQFPGKKRMKVRDYLKGNKIETGLVLY